MLLFPLPTRFVVILFCLFFNHIVFTYWLVSVCLYCCPLTPWPGAAIKVFLEVTIIRLININDVIVQIGNFTVFWKENIHSNKYVNQNIKKNHEVYLIIEILISWFFWVLFCFVRIHRWPWWLWQNPQRVYFFSQQFWRAGTVCEQGKKR